MGNADTKSSGDMTGSRVVPPRDAPIYIDPAVERQLRQTWIKNPNLTCPLSGRKITKLCLNPCCKYSPRCSDLGCSGCGKVAHPLCSSVTLQEVTDMLNCHISTCSDFMANIFLEEEALIQKIRKGQREFVQTMTSKMLDDRTLSTVTDLYDGKKSRRPSGKQVLDLCGWLQEELVGVTRQSKLLLKREKIRLGKIAAEVETLKEQVFRAFLDQKGSMVASTQASERERIDSKIIRLETQEGQSQLSFLLKSLNEPKNLQLLFRASEHNFSAQAFHDRCDGIHDTLVLVRTEFGKTVAGYTHYRWDQAKNGTFVHDMKKRAFLMQLDKRERMAPERDNRLIFCSSDCGPAFGWNDLLLSDRCNTEPSLADFPCTFNREGCPYKKDDQKSWNAFTGVRSGYKLLIDEYQVYRVDFS